MKKDGLPMMPWFPDSFIGGTFGWELDEIGLYHNLLCAQWLNGPLPNDALKLPLNGRCTVAAFEKAWPKVQPKFVETPAGLINERLEEHRVKALNLKKRASAGGKATAKKRAKPSAKSAPAVALKGAHLISQSLSLSEAQSQPKRGNGGGRAAEPVGSEGKLNFHSSLPIAEWNEWLTRRRQKKWPMDPLTLNKQLSVLARHPTEVQQVMIDKSINAGWQGIFEPKPGDLAEHAIKTHKAAPTTAELEERERREQQRA